MNDQPSGFISQPSSHNSQHTQPALSIRTATTSGALRGPPTSSPAQPHCTYPIPIQPTKLGKAIRLYTQYRYEEVLAQRVQPHGLTHADPLLSPATAHSVTSRSSRVYTPSVSTSAYEGVTDISSLVSFNGEESVLSGQGNSSTELIAFDGKRVKRRVRKPLSPIAKAKAALIRYLGSCSNCRSRRIPCPLEHHDIDALEKGRQSRSQKMRHQASQQQSHSSVSTSSRHAPDSGSVITVTTSGGSLGQSNTLLGLGQNEQLLQTIPTITADPLSIGDPLAGIQARYPSQRGTGLHLAGMSDSNDFSRFIDADPYESYQNGQLLVLGVFRQLFVCQHLERLCEQHFESPEELEDHFETDHFAFNRIRPSYRYRCSNCGDVKISLTDQCQNCPADRLIEMWIYGNFIRSLYYPPQYAPDRQDPFKIESPPFPQFMSLYDSTGTDSQFGPGPSDISGFNDNMNHDTYRY